MGRDNQAYAQLAHISGKSALGVAIRYGQTRIKRLRPYLDDGRLGIDNNAAERVLRGPVVGRKNFYGNRSKRGAKTAAILYSAFGGIGAVVWTMS